MIEAQEIVPVLIAAIIAWIGWSSRLRRDNRAAYRLLLGAFLLLVVGWVATVVEEVVMASVFDALEHVSRMLAGLLLAAACWRLVRDKGADDR